MFPRDKGEGSEGNVWIASLRIPVFRTVAQLVESTLDLVDFILTDHAGMVYIVPMTKPAEEICPLQTMKITTKTCTGRHFRSQECW